MSLRRNTGHLAQCSIMFIFYVLVGVLLSLFPLALLCLCLLLPFGVTPILVYTLLWWYSFPIAVLLLCGPWFMLWFLLGIVNGIKCEADKIRSVGKAKALWHDTEHTGFASWLLGTQALFEASILWGWDRSEPWVEMLCSALNLDPGAGCKQGRAGITVLGSLWWSRCILFLDDATSMVNYKSVITMGVGLWTFIVVKRIVKLANWLFWLLFVWCIVLYNIPFYLLLDGVWVLSKFLILSAFGGTSVTSLIKQALFLRFTVLLTNIVIMLEALNSEVSRNYSNRMSSGLRKYKPLFRSFVIRSVHFINDVSLPAFVRGRFSTTPSAQNVEIGRSIMKELGWPVNVELTDADEDAPLVAKFKEFLIGGSDIRTGIRNSHTYLEQNLLHLTSISEMYNRTESYKNTYNELESTSRYFKPVVDPSMPVDVDMVWHVVSDIFKHSKLTPFNYIIKMWEKKYALGFFMATENSDPGKRRKVSRRSFISSIGFHAFKELWRKTFYMASRVLPVAHVSVKDESLPPSKWMNNKVRSIIGSPLSQYIMSTIFNYGPNHRFSWDTTPIKIGMPLNGFWMARLFDRHSRHQIHCEGDFSSFDSTLSGPVIDMVKMIRKRGFSSHKDRSAIANLVDVNYDQVVGQVLGQTSTGNLWRKSTGLTTGHSSTSMDNSLATVTFYMMAWKQLTGKTAVEFMHHNELSCFGDDHILSISHVRPLSWKPSNISKTMMFWGVKNNLITKNNLYECSFLAKRASKLTPSRAKDFLDCNLPTPPMVVWHDRSRLIGKLTAPIVKSNPSYRARRLISYMTLCAHHKDVYDSILGLLTSSKALASVVKGSRMVVPSYKDVLKMWYKPSGCPQTDFEDDEERYVNNGELLTYGTPTLGDHLLVALAAVPDLFNPSTFNFGFMRSLQLKFGSLPFWPVNLVARSNSALSIGHIKYLMAMTPYKFLDCGLYTPGISDDNTSTLLVRHWLFMLYRHWSGNRRWLAWTELLLRKVANWQFLINGKVQLDVPRPSGDIDLLLVVSFLGLIHIPDWFSLVSSVSLPDIGALVDLIWNLLLVSIWSNVPANFHEVDPLFKQLGSGVMVVKSPTGTGKSTDLVQHLSSLSMATHRRVVVIEPRSLLVAGLSEFCSMKLGMSCSGGTSGHILDRTKRIWFVTPEYFFASLQHMGGESFLYVLDECHLDEPSYVVARAFLLGMKWPTVFMSATPTPSQENMSHLFVEIPVATLWDTEHKRVHLTETSRFAKHFVNHCLELSKSNPSRVKMAFIVDTPEQAEDCAMSCGLPSQVLSGKHGTSLDTNATRYWCTSVIDVGVTIPGLAVIVFPNWVYGGKDKVYALDSGTYNQRAGRVGRTCNGTAICVTFDTGFKDRPKTRLDAKLLGPLIAGGLPVAIAAKISPSSVAEVLDIPETSLHGENFKNLSRVAQVFIANMSPVFAASVVANDRASTWGDTVPLVDTGSGRFSSSQVPSHENLLDMVIGGVRGLIGTIVSDGSAYSYPPDALSLHRIAGSAFSVKNLFSALVNDPKSGTTDVPNPKTNIVGQDNNWVYEVDRISKLLADFSLVPDEDLLVDDV